MTDLEILLKSLAAMFEPILEIAEEHGEDGTVGYIPAWGTLLSPALCPGKDLGYLGQFVGVEVPQGATEAEARAAVQAESGLARGTLASIETAIRKVLGTEPFAVQERTSASGVEAAYHFNVIVGPGLATAALTEAIEAVTPGGVLFSVIEGAGMWLQAVKKWSEVGAGVKWPAATGAT